MANKQVNVLGAARLSIDTDESTSIERQTAGIEQWAGLRGNITGDDYHVIKVTEDSDVSGTINPFERAGLGPYLRKPLLDQWSVLVVYRLDRLTRSIADFEALWKHLEANGKTLASVAEQMDFGTMHGRLMARQFVIFAEYEREMIRARVKGAYDALQAQGKYAGLQFPFGYMPYKLEGKGWGLMPHPRYGPIVADVAQRLIDGEALSSICRWLDAEGIPTPRNAVREYKGKRPLRVAHWDTTALAGMLSSPTVIGETTSNGETLRDETKMPIHRAEPLLRLENGEPDLKTWEQVKSILADNAARIGPKVNVSPLLQVAFCDLCGGPLHSKRANPKKHGSKYRYYVCPRSARKRGCTAESMHAETLEALVHHTVLTQMGWVKLTETIEIKGSDYSTQMAELAEAIGALSSQIALARVRGIDTSKLEAQREIHERNLTTLASEPTIKPDSYERELDETWAERWNRLDWNGRNELLRRKGIKFYAKREGNLTEARMVGARYPVDEHGNPVPGEWVNSDEVGAELVPPDIDATA